MGSSIRGVLLCTLIAGCTGAKVGGHDSPDDPCAGRACSGHGTCAVTAGAAACVCDPGYEPRGLDCVQSGCTPASHASSACDQGDVYWYDSCGQREERKAKCGTAGCSAGACVEGLSAAPAQHAFGNVDVNAASAPFAFTVTNVGTGSATNVALTAGAGTDFTSSGNTCGTAAAKVTLAAGATCGFSVAFAPTSAGSKAASFTVGYDLAGASGRTAAVDVSGVGAAAAEGLTVTPAQHAFGTVDVNAAAAPFAFTVKNVGTGSATNVSVTAGAGADFTLSGNTCGTAAAKVTLAGGATCGFSVAFAPTSAGAKSTTFSVHYDLSGASGQTAGAAVSGVGATAGATITAYGITFPKAHPRLWFNDPVRLARAKAYFAAHPYSPSGNDAQSVIDRAMMHVVNGYDCAPAIQWALNYQTRSGYVPKPGDAGSDQMRNDGEALILVYDWCHDQLTDPAQQAKYVTDWNLWFGNVMRQSWGGASMSENNYFWGNLRNEMEWGIATYDENTQADAFLKNGISTRWSNAVAFFNGGGKGGVCSEGMDYGATLLQYPLIPFVTAMTGGRDVYAESGRFYTAVYWLLYAGLPGKTYNAGTRQTDWEWFTYSDDEHAFWGGGDRQRVMYYGDFMAEAVNLWPGSAGRYAQAFLDRVAPDQTKVTEADVSPVAPADLSTLPLDFYGSGYGYYYGRSAWGGAATVFHLQLELPGNETGHYHWDAGNFQLWRNGRWLTREATGYALSIPDYGGTGSTSVSYGPAHNLPMVNGLGPMGWHWRVAGPAVVRRLESRAGYSYADVELTQAFQGRDDHPEYVNDALVSLEREFVFVRPLETMVVLDRIQMASPDGGTTPATSVKGTFVLHTETAPTVEDANHLLVVNGTQALRLTTLIPTAGGTYRQLTEPETFTRRTELDYAGGSGSACNGGKSCIYQLNVLQARDQSASNLAATLVDSSPSTPLSGTLTVTLRPSAGAEVVLVFQKGTQSSGGSITIDGTATPLRTDVQPISYTENGPAWQ